MARQLEWYLLQHLLLCDQHALQWKFLVTVAQWPREHYMSCNQILRNNFFITIEIRISHNIKPLEESS